jgi:uncharacterized membrane protein
MGRITITKTIEAPIEAVFAYVDDYKNTTKYMRDLSKWEPIGGKKHGLGAVFEVGMKAGPKVLESTIEMDKWVENKTIAWESTDGFWQKGSWVFKTKAGKTEATYDMEYEFGGGIAGKLLAKAAEPIVRMNIEKSIAELKVQCEKLPAKKPAAAGR